MARWVKLKIKSADSGLALYYNDDPWFYHKHGDDIVALLREVVPACDEVEYAGTISAEEREEEFA